MTKNENLKPWLSCKRRRRGLGFAGACRTAGSTPMFAYLPRHQSSGCSVFNSQIGFFPKSNLDDEEIADQQQKWQISAADCESNPFPLLKMTPSDSGLDICDVFLWFIDDFYLGRGASFISFVFFPSFFLSASSQGPRRRQAETKKLASVLKNLSTATETGGRKCPCPERLWLGQKWQAVWEIHFLIGKPEPSSTTRPSFLGSAFPDTGKPLSLHRYTVSVVGIHLASRHLPPVFFFFFFFLRLIRRICRTCRFRGICIIRLSLPLVSWLPSFDQQPFFSFLMELSSPKGPAQTWAGFVCIMSPMGPRASLLQRTDICQNISYVRKFLSRALSGPSHADPNKIFTNFISRNNWLIHPAVYHIV